LYKQILNSQENTLSAAAAAADVCTVRTLLAVTTSCRKGDPPLQNGKSQVNRISFLQLKPLDS